MCVVKAKSVANYQMLFFIGLSMGATPQHRRSVRYA